MKTPESLVKFDTYQDLTATQRQDVDKYHERHGIDMERFAVFSREKFESILHKGPDEEAPGYKEMILAEEADHADAVVPHYEVFRRIANLERPLTTRERQEYLDSLLAIYRLMSDSGCGPERFLDDEQALFVGPEREGCILAKQMGWNPDPPVRFKNPDAKRIPNGDDGLIVGLNDLDLGGRPFQRAILIDGAIASGATLIAVMKSLRETIGEFYIYCIHTTRQALNAVKSYSARHNLAIHVVAGKVTTSLSSKYYANYWDEDEGRMRYEVGDLGDTIAPLFPKETTK